MSSKVRVQVMGAALCVALAACSSSSQPSDASARDAALDTGGGAVDAGRPCTATCQCQSNDHCVAGHCVFDFSPGQFTPDCVLDPLPDGGPAVIGGPSCLCGGGTCEEDPYSHRGCCVAPDGHVADDLTDAICRM